MESGPNRAERGQGELEGSFLAKKSVAFIAGILILFGLYLSSLYNYLLFHILTEIFSIVVAWTIFILAWNSRRIIDNNYLLFIGIAFLFIGGLDLVHTLGYKGMGIFHGYAANLPTQLWIAARYMESLSFFIAPMFLTRRLRADLVLIVYALVTALVLGLVFYWHIFPTCFVEGVGLTPFKKISEYIISIILIGAITFLFQKRKEFDEKVFRLLVAAMVITIAAELAFTFYISAYGFSNLVGHYFKIISFYLIYKAIIETGLTKPYNLLFRNLKQSEEAVQESEKKYRQIFETNKAVKLMIDPESGTIIEANEAACNYYGYSKKEMETLEISDINVLPPEKIHLEMQKAKSEERLYFSFPHRLASGEIRNVEVYSGPVNLGEKTLLYSIIHDVTDRIGAEKRIQENEARYRLLFNSGNDAVFVHQPDEDGKPGHFIEANEVACQMYGYTRDEFLRLTPLDLVISDDESYVCKKVKNVLSGKQSVFENTHKRKTGEEIPVEISPHLFDLDGRPTILSRVLDITEHKRSEKERQNLLARLQQSQKMEAVGTLAGGIAHDFNNILAVILGNAELASDDVPDWNPASKSLKEIHKASIRAKDMVQQLLAFSRKTDEVSMPINIAPIIKESLKMLKHAIPTSVEFKQHISDDSCNVMGDASQINQIVMNLVTNAADAMSEEGGLLKVTLENIILQEEKICFDWVLSPGPYVRLRMRDTGEGIEPKIMDRIFEPYYTTKEVGKGTGMGLSVIHGIMKRHNGGIRVESEVEKGTLFEIYFPALEKAAEEEKKPEGEIKGGSERILFVDDEESMVNLNHQRLERLGYTVKSTTKPVEALEWFRADPGQFDVIITDMTMPRMTGDRLTKEVLTIRPHMPVIICTGYSERMSAKKAEGLGVRKYLEKPIGLRNMASALREVLDDGPMSVVPT